MKTKKDKDVTTVLSIPFWKSIALFMKTFKPFVKLLHLVYGDAMPSMYDELIKANRDIKEVFGNVEKNHKEVMSIVDKKIKNRLNSPLHMEAYMLNPYVL